MKRLAALVCLIAASGSFAAQPGDADFIDEFSGKPRLLVLTDIGNEPDDQMSMVRLMLYSNELDIEGLVATTSTWQRERVRPDMIAKVVGAYGEVQPNLLKHALRSHERKTHRHGPDITSRALASWGLNPQGIDLEVNGVLSARGGKHAGPRGACPRVPRARSHARQCSWWRERRAGHPR